MQQELKSVSTLGIISINGEKSQEFLQGQFTCDINKLTQTGHYSLGACCDHKGRMIANFWVLKRSADFILILPKSMRDIICNHLKKYAVFSKVELTPIDNLYIYSSSSNIPTNSDGFNLTLPNNSRHLTICPNQKLTQSEDTTWQQQNIEDKLCLLEPETSGIFTPQMINLEKLGGVSFEKGCYVGQEIVARTQYLGKLKRHLHRTQITADKCPRLGSDLTNNTGEKIGVICAAEKIDTNKVDLLAVVEDRFL